ncbi:MAG: hypothetical protein HFJ53_02040 [Clostridia bacterium]|nr:hypothetical protein [Clostridia bacterium]
MNSVKARMQLESLKRDRLSFIHNNDLDEIYLNDIKAINLAIKALNKCPDVKDTSFNCRMCNKELKTWKSIQRGFGPICEKKYLENVYKNQQISMDTIINTKGKER